MKNKLDQIMATILVWWFGLIMSFYILSETGAPQIRNLESGVSRMAWATFGGALALGILLWREPTSKINRLALALSLALSVVLVL